MDETLIAGLSTTMPGRKRVSYQSRAGEGFGDAFSVSDVEKRTPTANDLPDGQSVLTANDSIFYVWKTNMAGITPKTGDKFTLSEPSDPDYEVVFTVRQVSTFLLGQRYRLFCSKGR